MANIDTKTAKNLRNQTLDRQAVTTTSTIYGSDILWDVTTAAAAYTITVADYDASKAFDNGPSPKPHVLIRSSVDTSVNNVTIEDSAGSTLYTLAADHSTTNIYVVLRRPVDGSRLWELA